MFLDSKYESLLSRLAAKMQEAAREKSFEEAAKIRDQINALSALGQTQTGFSRQEELEDFKKLLRLAKLPQRIEAFDISNISGKEATGSMVSFYKGMPDKNNYRRFRIKTVQGIDDYEMISEVVHRRYLRLVQEKLPLPDLILIDGGRAHLLTAKKQLDNLGLKVPLVSIAKDQENIYVQNRAQPIKLNSDTPGLNLIRRIRDEAHRFAIKYHHLLHRKKIIGK
jgi:excinuclease ABC subunit C